MKTLFKCEVNNDLIDFIENFMGFDSFIFIKNYMTNAGDARLETSKILYENFKDLNSGRWDKILNDEVKKRRIAHTLQVDLLCKAVMTIEDLSTLSETLTRNPKKIRRNICNNSKVDFIRDKKFRDDNSLIKIFGYPKANLITEDADGQEVYNKLVQNEVNFIKSIYEGIAEFFDKYYDFYLAFKHSYSRIFINFTSTSQPVKEHENVIDEIIGLCPKRGDIRFKRNDFKKWIHNENQFKGTIGMLDISFYLIDTILRTLLKKVLYKSENVFPFEMLTAGKYPEESQRRLNDLVFRVEKSLVAEEDFMPAIGDMEPIEYSEYKQSILEQTDDDFGGTEFGSFK